MDICETLFNDADHERISNLCRSYPDEILYVAFAICVDHTGNRYVEGFVKTASRCRVASLQAKFGDVFFKTVSDIKSAIRDIHSNSHVEEQGDASAVRRLQVSINNAMLLKEVLNKQGLEKTLLSVPNACSDYPRLMYNHIVKNYKPIVVKN